MEIEKKQYTKPQLKTIELKAEEVMAAGCKTSTRSGPARTFCTLANCAGTSGS